MALVIFANVRGVPADAAWGEAYGGVFVGAGFQENRIVDPRGFAYWGRRGWGTDYDDDADLAGGFVLGRKYELNGARFSIEAPLADAWTWRLDGSYLGFGRSTHYVNRSGNNPCGPGGPEEACPYKVENDLSILRLAIIRRFDF